MHEKFELNSPSLVQSAFTLHGLDAQGSGTNDDADFGISFMPH